MTLKHFCQLLMFCFENFQLFNFSLFRNVQGDPSGQSNSADQMVWKDRRRVHGHRKDCPVKQLQGKLAKLFRVIDVNY